MNSFMRRVEVPRCAVVFLFRCLHRCRFVVCIYFLLCFWKNWRKFGPPCISFLAFKITLSVRPQRNNNTELKRLFTMKIRHFSVCFFCGMSVSKGLSCIVESWARIEIPNGVQKFSSYSNFNHGGTFSISNITTLH